MEFMHVVDHRGLCLGVVLPFGHAEPFGDIPRQPGCVVRNNVVYARVSHQGNGMLVADGDGDGADSIGIFIAQLQGGLKRHALDRIKGQRAVGIEAVALWNERYIDHQTGAAHGPDEGRHLGVTVPFEFCQSHIEDRLHGVHQVRHLEV